MTYPTRRHSWRWHARRVALACALALGLTLAKSGVADAHSVLVRSQPGPDTTVPQAPPDVRLFFSEGLNAALSRAVVLDAHHTNQLINTQPSRLASDTEIDVPLPPKLGDGQYLVVWRSVSSNDGHILEDAFCFTVAAANGPSAPCTLPTGTIPGLGATSAGSLGGGALLAALAWVGGTLWQIVVLRVGIGLPGALGDERGVVWAARQNAIDRFERSLGWLIGAVLVGNVLIAVGGAILSGAGLGDGLRAILTQSQFGTYWFLRQIAVLAGLLVLVLLPLSAAPVEGDQRGGGGVALAVSGARGGTSVGSAVATERHLLVRDGLALGAGMAALLATSLSGHAAAVTGALAPFAVPVDWLHLLSTSAWVGGIWYIAAQLLPVIARDSPAERGRVLVHLLPLFSPMAFAAVIVLALAGSFNSRAHLTSLAQLINTGYGIALSIKLLMVATMIAISAWHVWRIRPRVARALASNTGAALARATRLVGQFERLLRVEASLGVGVIVCVAAMGVLAGSLTVASSSSSGQPVVLNQTTAIGLSVTLAVAPVKTGGNATTVTVRNAQGAVLATAQVSVDSTMLDMPMGTQTNAMTYSSDSHDYNGSIDFFMAGRWQMVVHVSPGNGQPAQQATFMITVGT